MTETLKQLSMHTLQMRELAHEIAEDLLQRRALGIKSVELFGSLSLGEVKDDSDIDIILVVDPFTAGLWAHKFMRSLLTKSWPRSQKTLRRDAAHDVLRKHSKDRGPYLPDIIDVFLFPPKWRNRLDEIGQFHERWNYQFLLNLAEEAIPFEKKTGFPFPSVQLPQSIRVSCDPY